MSLHHFLCPYDDKWTGIVNLGNDHLSGVIPECWEKWPSLEFLNLEDNSLSGGNPRTLGFSSELFLSNSAWEQSFREIACFFDEIDKVRNPEMNLWEVFHHGLRENSLLREFSTFDGINLIGIFPMTFVILDLFRSWILLTTICQEISKDALTALESFLEKKRAIHISHLHSLVMKGREDIYNTNLGLVMLFDLSSNNFSGHIPSELTVLQELKSLNLSRNHLTGRIPEKIGDMKSLYSLDISQNKLSGELPRSLSGLSFTGRVPSSTQLQSFSESSYGDRLIDHDTAEVADRDQEEDEATHGAKWGDYLHDVWIYCRFLDSCVSIDSLHIDQEDCILLFLE